MNHTSYYIQLSKNKIGPYKIYVFNYGTIVHNLSNVGIWLYKTKDTHIRIFKMDSVICTEIEAVTRLLRVLL